jgi:hypothetical protein
MSDSQSEALTEVERRKDDVGWWELYDLLMKVSETAGCMVDLPPELEEVFMEIENKLDVLNGIEPVSIKEA